jgi:hypothetical protein
MISNELIFLGKKKEESTIAYKQGNKKSGCNKKKD